MRPIPASPRTVGEDEMGLKVKALAAMLALSPWSLAMADAIDGRRGPSEIVASAKEDDWRYVDPAQLMILELEEGQVVIELSARFAQGHVAQMKALAKAGFYDGLSFYRVIEGFVAQGGDVFEARDLPAGAVGGLTAEFDETLDDSAFAAIHTLSVHRNAEGTGNSGYARATGVIDGFPVGMELNGASHKFWLLHCTGAVAMARDTARDTGGTEIYITLQPQRYLDRNLTVFGRVIDGMTHVQALTRQAPPEAETDPLGDVIKRAWMADAPPEGETAPQYRVMKNDTPLFDEYVESRRNRPEAFFYYRPDYVDVCQLPIPVERVISSEANDGEGK